MPVVEMGDGRTPGELARWENGGWVDGGGLSRKWRTGRVVEYESLGCRIREVMARKVTIRSYLRPARIGFLVDPRDRKALAKVFEVNTCLWGGIFNPIIPLVRRVPNSWRDPVGPPPSPRDLRRGYIDAFEPDVVVVLREEHKALAEGLEVHLCDDVFGKQKSDLSITRIGRSVHEHYRQLYHDVFRFVLRDPATFIVPIAKDARYDLFVSAVLGSFARNTEELKIVQGWYEEAFHPEKLQISKDTLLDALNVDTLSPMNVNRLRLEVGGVSEIVSNGAFLCDPTEALDLVDFWNLRALGRSLVPIPIQWGQLLQSDVSLGWHGNEQAYLITVSRSVGLERAQALLEQIEQRRDRRTILNPHYPQLYDPWGGSLDNMERVRVCASEADTEVEVEDDDFVNIPLIRPSLREQMSSMLRPPKWCNVVEYSDFRSRDRIASVIPSGLGDIRSILGAEARVTSEGIVFCREAPGRLRFRLPRSFSVAKAWFAAQGMQMNLSGPGRTMQHLLDSLEGVDGVWTILDPDLLRMLERMATGLVEEEVSFPEGPRRKKRRYTSYDEFSATIAKISAKQQRDPELWKKALLRKRIVRIGAVLNCERCEHPNWYPVGDLRDLLRCERCLSDTRFPAQYPRSVQWAYRVNGAFAVPDYCDGGYVGLAAMRFLNVLREHEATCVPSVTITGKESKSFEIDFLMWVRERRYWCREERYLVAGECKTHGHFEPKDIRRMQQIAKQFPGTVLVFATFRDQLESNERIALQRLAQWGRAFRASDGWRAPLIVLTNRELFSFDGAPTCWGGDSSLKEKIDRFDHAKKLEATADLTQQIYLGMRPYHEWAKEEADRRLSRKRGRES